MSRPAVWSLMLLAVVAFWSGVIAYAFHLSFDALDHISEWRMPVNIEAQP